MATCFLVYKSIASLTLYYWQKRKLVLNLKKNRKEDFQPEFLMDVCYQKYKIHLNRGLQKFGLQLDGDQGRFFVTHLAESFCILSFW